MPKTTRTSALVTVAALALALAGCKKPVPEAEQSDVSNALVEVPAEVDLTPPPVAVAPVAPPPATVVVRETTTTTIAPAEQTVREEQQIQDDADAVGMTARLPAERDTQPVDAQAEAKDKQ